VGPATENKLSVKRLCIRGRLQRSPDVTQIAVDH